jgi:hypothetical protein
VTIVVEMLTNGVLAAVVGAFAGAIAARFTAKRNGERTEEGRRRAEVRAQLAALVDTESAAIEAENTTDRANSRFSPPDFDTRIRSFGERVMRLTAPLRDRDAEKVAVALKELVGPSEQQYAQHVARLPSPVGENYAGHWYGQNYGEPENHARARLAQHGALGRLMAYTGEGRAEREPLYRDVMAAYGKLRRALDN